jgi:hypothetical protein
MQVGFAQQVKKTAGKVTTTPAATTKTTTPAVSSKATTAAKPAPQQSGPWLGRYELYSGIPTIYIGHFILLPNGKYKVAFDTAPEDYDETGRYAYHADTNTIEWISGMFFNNNWHGKMVQKDGGYRVEFNKASYGEKGAAKS